MTQKIAELYAGKMDWLKWLRFFLVVASILVLLVCALSLPLISKGVIEDSAEVWEMIHNLCLVGFVLTAAAAVVVVVLAKKDEDE